MESSPGWSLGVTTPSDSSFCPHVHGLLQGSRTGMRCCSQQEQTTAPGKGLIFQTINAHRTLQAAITIFLKMKFFLPKVLEFCSDDPVSC